MKFELKPNNRNSSDKDLIKDVIEVAKKLRKESISRDEYNKHGRYSEGTLRKRFGGWLNVLKIAGLSSTKDYNVSDEELISELQRIAKLPNVEILTRDVFNKYKKISNTTKIERRFGSWTEALKKSGLHVSRSQKRGYSDKELFENILNVWTYNGRQPTVTDIGEHPSKITRNTYSNRFGNWRNALEAFVEYANKGQAEAYKKAKEVKEAIEVVEEKSLKIKHVKHKTSRTINLRLRFLVMKQDNFKCKNCGRSPATNPHIILHVDHIKPWSNGGETILENLQTLCSKCNLGKSNI
ncbi:MAG: homing endonuclease associated repeat-containing protein [Candidatus Altimarinota bacterium]